MLKIGLTGGIGSGKTTVANLFAEYHVKIIDADDITKQLLTSSKPVVEEIINRWGVEVLEEKGNINRKKIRSLIFEKETERNWLEKLLHPLIKQEINQQISNTDSPYCIIVIPLLVETNSYDLIDRILVVDSSEQAQINRAALRDHLEKDQIEKILNIQASREKRLEVADDVIENHGSIEELKQQIANLHRFYLMLC